MKRGFFIVLLGFFTSSIFGTSAAQNAAVGDTVNMTDAGNLKQGHWVFYGKDHPEWKCADETKVEEGEYKDNLKEGIWKQYYCEGNLKNEITYVDDKPLGYAKFYYKTGKISEEGFWKNQKWDGAYKYYHENGNLAYEWNYENGRRQGKQVYYHPNGKVMIEGNWNGGKEDGEQREYYADGTLKSIKDYSGGKINPDKTKVFEKKVPEKKEEEVAIDKSSEHLNEIPLVVKGDDLGVFTGTGNHKLYNKRKQIWKEGYFEGGRLINGKIYQYGKRHKLERIAVFKNGILIQEEIVE
ncbi:MAG: toxin-antitoxin system YwqK family antitoxin [Flavobacteriales bacterium]|nr:toxin-antitoxin system YwqK family antitoxin [Flavobacteriales bacterium]MCB9449409.1 toxin-antitoxin system YwqK family antitoxin [Flavobacteriales bacterium]